MGGRQANPVITRTERMRIVRIFAGEHGELHFADVEVPTQSVRMFPQMPVFHLNRFATPRGVKFFVVPDELRVADGTPRPNASSRWH